MLQVSLSKTCSGLTDNKVTQTNNIKLNNIKRLNNLCSSFLDLFFLPFLIDFFSYRLPILEVIDRKGIKLLNDGSRSCQSSLSNV